jgi:hypothetical protein
VLIVVYRRYVAAAEAGEQARPRRFPALDPEPPPRPWWHWLVGTAAAAVVVVAIVAAAEFWPWSGHRPPAGGAPFPAAASFGRILVQTTDDHLALADPDGQHYTRLNVRGLQPAPPPGPALSPDGRYVTTLSQVIGVSGGKPTAALQTRVDPSQMILAASPFADHDRVLVAIAAYYRFLSSLNPIAAYDLATGGQTSLGTGDNVAGDPAAPGVFVSVAAPVQASATAANPELRPDSRVELRDAGHRPVVLATVTSLSRVLGLDPSQQAALVPTPDPAGDKVAVQVELVNGGEPAGGVVVLSRAGRVLGYVPPASGPRIGVPVTWSPTGRSLAFPSIGGGGPELITWTVGARPRARYFPGASYTYGQCLWSPGEAAILCTAFRSGPAPQQKWVIASAQGGPMALVAARGSPLGWLGPAGGR